MLRIALMSLVFAGCVAQRASTPAPPPRPSPPTEPPARVALLHLKASDDSSRALSETMAELVAFELEDTGRFDVLSRQDLSEAVRLKGTQQLLSCETEACQGELARSVDVDRFVTGSLGKLGDTYVLVLRLVESNEVRVVRQARDTAAGREEDLLSAARRTAWTLAGLDEELPARKTEESDVGRRIGEGLITGAVREMGRGLRSVGAIVPSLTAELEAALASSLADRLREMRAARATRSGD